MLVDFLFDHQLFKFFSSIFIILCFAFVKVSFRPFLFIFVIILLVFVDCHAIILVFIMKVDFL